MKKPTLEQIKATYKHAKIVKCASEIYNNSNGIFDISTFTDFREGKDEFHLGEKDFNISENDEFVTLWNRDNGYAEIIEYKTKQMKKVIRLDEEKEESKKPIELTHFMMPEKGWEEYNRNPNSFDKIVYLGYCGSEKTDKFVCFHTKSDNIEFWKGHLNDGVY